MLNISFANGAAGILSYKADPTSMNAISAASNASGGNTSYTATTTFSPTIPAGTVVSINGFVAHTGNNIRYGVVVSCNASTLVVVNANGVAETHAATVTTAVPALFFGPGGGISAGNGYTATVGLPQNAFDPPTNNSWTASQAGRMWYNTVDRAVKIWGDSAIHNLVSSTNISATGLTANYNSGSAATIFTPTAPTRLRVTATEAITIAATTGAATSTLPSLTLGYTDVGGIARTVQMLATSGTNTTAVYETASELIYTDGSTPVTITSASYASNTAAQMTYYLIATAEII